MILNTGQRLFAVNIKNIIIGGTLNGINDAFSSILERFFDWSMFAL